MKGIGGVLNVDFMVKILPAQGFEPATFFKKSTFILNEKTEDIF